MELYKYIDRTQYTTIDNNIVELINTTKNINNIDTKIINQENEYNKNINELSKLFNNSVEYSVIKKQNSLELLQKEHHIIKLISKYSLQNNNASKSFLINTFNLLLQISNILKDRLNQKDIVKLDQTKAEIVRCSYKFCNFKENCVYNYKKKSNCCYQDHYVHNMVSHDLIVLIEYIESMYPEETIKPNKEILKSLNTLSFVINHMENELKALCLYQDTSEWEKFHIYKCKKSEK